MYDVVAFIGKPVCGHGGRRINLKTATDLSGSVAVSGLRRDCGCGAQMRGIDIESKYIEHKILAKKHFTNQMSDNIMNLHNILKITKVL